MVSNGEVTQKVVVHFADGRTIWGFIPESTGRSEGTLTAEAMEVTDTDGKCLKIQPADVKAIFLVRSFEGDPNYAEYKSFIDRSTGNGVWLRVHFQDGEILEGVGPNTLATFLDSMFYLTPPDPRSNNHAVLVSKSSLSQMQVLGLAAS